MVIRIYALRHAIIYVTRIVHCFQPNRPGGENVDRGAERASYPILKEEYPPIVPLPKLPKPKRPPLPPGLIYADHNYPMTKSQYLRWLARKERKGRR